MDWLYSARLTVSSTISEAEQDTLGNYLQISDCLPKFSLLRLVLTREQPWLMSSSTMPGLTMARAEVGWLESKRLSPFIRLCAVEEY